MENKYDIEDVIQNDKFIDSLSWIKNCQVNE